MAVVAGSAEAASVKCQERAVEAEIIVHERDGAVSVVRAEEMAEAGLNASFRAFVTEVLGQLPGLLEKAGLCTAEGDRVMQAQFVHVPLIAEAFTPHAYATEAPQDAACRVTSPWVHFSDVPDRRPRFKARFFWNERQVLFDQAVLAGAPADPLPLEPINWQTYGDSLWLYQDEEMLVPEPKRQPIAHRIPADVLWLFRGSWQTDFVPFSSMVNEALDSVLEQAAPRQASLATRLMQSCLDAGGEHRSISTIQDTGGIIALDAYRIREIR
jgi:hypothetical protein